MAISSANNTGSPNLANVLNPVGFSSSTSSQARLTAFNQLRTADLDNNFVKQASHVTDLAMSANAAAANQPGSDRYFPEYKSRPTTKAGCTFDKEYART